ncbi:endonuclease Q family protein [Gracilibacillus caseinilyticus]|uniref:Endonuclease Q family protein n=1 Tax=Gracilibacillus caseinilyticus TaxID=2932256 RepID=A0ABY4EUP3_9BACI|nr:endonuclease Q family protein [Gracilibacillus caseinilyticus]UOQ47522.1 endonuclease Q family protein [Gracilibacillus caseinilyticus]
MLKDYYADLHIHVGRNQYGGPVKITASKHLTIENILLEASERKGIDIVGVIDCQAPAVLEELQQLLSDSKAVEKKEGGIQFGNTTLMLGSEIEIYDQNCAGPIHVLCYFPFLKSMTIFSNWLSDHMKNSQLSSQRFYGSAVALQQKTKELDGIFIPAHVFTPFKSLFGKGVRQSLEEVFNPEWIDAIELGLSADTHMADQIAELHRYTYVTNSDAHSLAKIAREYQLIRMAEPTFKELQMAFHQIEERKVIKNFGMNPRLGKYYTTVCQKCLRPYKESPCPQCESVTFIKGVADRIAELKTSSQPLSNRPAYLYQVPLEYIPALGPKTLDKLIDHFGNEMSVIHHVNKEALIPVIGNKIAEMIIQLREGKLLIESGGGGKYGKIAHK